MNIFIQKLKSLLPLVIVSLGVLFYFSGHPSRAQEVVDIAPYAFAESKEVSALSLLNKEIRFLKKRTHNSHHGGLDLAALAQAYAAKSNLTGDLKLMDLAEKKAQQSLVNLPFYNYGAKRVLIQVAESRHLFPQALELGEALLLEQPGNAAILSDLLTAALGHGEIQRANAYADQLIQVSPTMESYILRALTLLGSGQNDAALRDFNHAITIESAKDRETSSWVRTLVGRYFLKNGDFANATAYTESALNVVPDYHLAIAQKADLKALENDSESAIRLYKKAYRLREEPPYLLAHARLCESLARPKCAARLRRKAEKSVRKEIETTPYGHYNELAQILIDRKDPAQREEAISAATKNVEQRANAESYYLLAQAYANSGRWDEARTSLQTAIQSGETNIEFQKLAEQIEAKQF